MTGPPMPRSGGSAADAYFRSRPLGHKLGAWHDVAWVQDKASPVDTINGFIEVYLDAGALAYRPAGELEAGRKLA